MSLLSLMQKQRSRVQRSYERSELEKAGRILTMLLLNIVFLEVAGGKNDLGNVLVLHAPGKLLLHASCCPYTLVGSQDV